MSPYLEAAAAHLKAIQDKYPDHDPPADVRFALAEAYTRLAAVEKGISPGWPSSWPALEAVPGPVDR